MPHHRILSGAFAAAMLAAPGFAASSVTFNAGPVVHRDDFPYTPAEILAFELGEDVLVTIDFSETDLAVFADLDPAAQRGYFEDPWADVTLTGATSGAAIFMPAIGAIVEVDGPAEIDFNTFWLVSDLDPFGLGDASGSDIDIGFGWDVFSDPDDLQTSIDEFIALLSPDGVLWTRNTAFSSTGGLAYYVPAPGEGEVGGPPPGSGFTEEWGLEFGAVASVPAPAAAPLLLLGAGLLAAAGRRRG